MTKIESPPLVSIIIPSFNRADLIAETLLSVQQQTYPFWEALVIDDGSTDDTLSIVSSFSATNNRFRFFSRKREPKGAPTCRNIGIEKAQGAYIIFLDSDDLLAPTCLQDRVAVMERNPNLAFAVFPMQFFDQQIGDSSAVWLYHHFDNYLSGFLLKSQWQTTSPIWNAEFVRGLGGFTEGLVRWQDWDIHVRALVEDPTFVVVKGDPDCFCRRGNKRMSDKIKNVDRYLGQFELFNSTVGLLDRKGKLSDFNKNLLAGLYMNLAKKFYSTGDTSRALEVWGTTEKLRLINKQQLTMGEKYIRLQGSLFFKKKYPRKILRRIFAKLLPPDMIWHN